MRRTDFADGAPCWVDATVPDMERARHFYGSVLGWAFADQGADAGHYTMCLADDTPVAALMPPQPQPDGAPAMWNVYLATSDVDATARTAAHHDGKMIMNPMDVMNRGRMAVVMDPMGATFGMWQGREHRGAGLWGDPGSVAWNELATPDGVRADAFYQAVFGYDEQAPIGDETFDYSIWKAGGHEVCGRWQTTDRSPQWITYFAVTDTDDALQEVSRLSGEILSEPQDTPHGRIAQVRDPLGLSFHVVGPVRAAA